ncbi:MAG: class I SAM-dependent methyltransferase [Actinomycetota bacterium]|nr:class I SAM-dependent methyltransferase [Actinomycetota bacterium]
MADVKWPKRMSDAHSPCDLCAAPDPVLLLHSPRLDGPLVRCWQCGLVYVGRRHQDFTFVATDSPRSEALAGRVADLGIVRIEVEEAERALRLAAERERLASLLPHAAGGRLLDVGCALGSFLEVATSRFAVTGVEPDPGTSAQARAAGLEVLTGAIDDILAPPGATGGEAGPGAAGFDALTMFHVIEHLDSPQRALRQARSLLAPGGVLMIETPTVDCLWFRLTPRRWRQLIPDHYYFFSRATLEALLRRCDFQPVAYAKVGRRVSLRFLADRLRRSGFPLATGVSEALRLSSLGDRTVRVNPGDIMQVVAVAR